MRFCTEPSSTDGGVAAILARSLDRGGARAGRHDRVEHRVLLWRGGRHSRLGQLQDITGGVISERIGGRLNR